MTDYENDPLEPLRLVADAVLKGRVPPTTHLLELGWAAPALLARLEELEQDVAHLHRECDLVEEERAELLALPPWHYTCGCPVAPVTDKVNAFCPKHDQPLKREPSHGRSDTSTS
jgi:hypothetical protein